MKVGLEPLFRPPLWKLPGTVPVGHPPVVHKPPDTAPPVPETYALARFGILLAGAVIKKADLSLTPFTIPMSCTLDTRSICERNPSADTIHDYMFCRAALESHPRESRPCSPSGNGRLRAASLAQRLIGMSRTPKVSVDSTCS